MEAAADTREGQEVEIGIVVGGIVRSGNPPLSGELSLNESSHLK